MSYRVIVKKKAIKSVKKLSAKLQFKVDALILDLKTTGACQPKWPHYSKLGRNKYHCHLDKSKRWVACWEKL